MDLKEKIGKVVSERIQKLNEELSIAEEVKDVVDDVCRKLLEQYDEVFENQYQLVQFKMDDGDVVPIKVGVFLFGERLAGKAVNIQVMIYQAPTVEYMLALFDKIDVGGNFQLGFDAHKITLTSCAAANGGRPDNQFFRGNLQHELTHAYQTIKSDNQIYGPQYAQAVSVMKDVSISEDSGEKAFAYAIYWTSNIEIDAKANGLFAELVRILTFTDFYPELRIEQRVLKGIGVTNYLQEKERVKTYVNDAKEWLQKLSQPALDKLCNQYGFRGLKHILSYLNNGLQRIETKERKVVAAVVSRMRMDEGHIFREKFHLDSKKMFWR